MGKVVGSDGIRQGLIYTRGLGDVVEWPIYHPDDDGLRVGSWITNYPGGVPRRARRAQPVRLSPGDVTNTAAAGSIDWQTEGAWSWQASGQGSAAVPLMISGTVKAGGGRDLSGAALLRIDKRTRSQAVDDNALLTKALDDVIAGRVDPSLFVVPSVSRVTGAGVAAVASSIGVTLQLSFDSTVSPAGAAAGGLPPVNITGVGRVDHAQTTKEVKSWTLASGTTPVYGRPYGVKTSLLKRMLGKGRYFIVDTDTGKLLDIGTLEKRLEQPRYRKDAQQEQQPEEPTAAPALRYSPDAADIGEDELRAMSIADVFEPVTHERMNEVFVPRSTSLHNAAMEMATLAAVAGSAVAALRQLRRRPGGSQDRKFLG